MEVARTSRGKGAATQRVIQGLGDKKDKVKQEKETVAEGREGKYSLHIL